MTDRIRQTASLSDREQDGLFRWSPDPFDIMHLDLEWRPKDLHFLLDRDGRTVSHLGILRHAVRVGDTPMGSWASVAS